MADLTLFIRSTEAVAAYEKALFLPEFRTLLVSDLHFGKAAHFRKHGIGVPLQADFENLSRLESLIGRFNPTTLLLAGDAFHSGENASVKLFAEWRGRYPTLSINLVAGNHDVMATATYVKLGIEEVGAEVKLGELAVVHDPKDAGRDPDAYYLGGHVHPAVHVPGKAGRVSLPALVLGERLGLLPCFGAFTGTAAVPLVGGERVCLFSGTRVFAMPGAIQH